ncbi:MAG: fibronectin type III domain-containing protein [Planctomycetia bacterium]
MRLRPGRLRSRTSLVLSLEPLESRQPLAVGATGTAAPTILTVSAVSASEIGLSWELGDAAASPVVVERRTGSDGAFATLAVLPAGETIYTDTGCWAATSYDYRVKVRGAGGDSAYSPVQMAASRAIAANAYATVADLAVAATSSTTATVSFTDPNPAGVSYLLERSANGLAFQVVASLGASTRWEDTGLDPGAIYWYRVRGTGWTQGTSDYSAAARVLLPERPAAAPIEPAAVTADAVSATAVRIAWLPRDPAPAAYVVERSVGYDPWHPIAWTRVATTEVGATSFVDTGLAAETPYVYRVRATRGGVESDAGRPAADVMHVLFGTGVGVVTASAGTGAARTYDIGPGRPLSRLADLDWSRVGPGVTGHIHFKPGGYHELFQVAGRGTPAAWITVNGVPDPVTGALPVIDGADAVLAPQFRNHWAGLHGYGAVVFGARPGFIPGYKPGYIAIRGLEVRNCSIGNSFTDVDGARKAYGRVGAGIYLERCDHVTISGCTIRDNGEGIFGAGQSTFDRLMTDIVVDSNRIFGNGNVGSDREHNTYIEAIGTVYQFNRYGPLRPGALGAGLKDRSAGTVIRGNWIEGGQHQLQIPEAQNQADLAVALPQYRVTVVQGNTLVAPPGNGASPIWFGGDQGLPTWYRKGVLYVHHNTLVARSNQADNYKITAIVAASGAEAIDVRNTIIAAIPDTPGARPAELGLVGADNRAAFGRTWVTPGWLPTTVGDYSFTGRIGGTDRLLVGGTVDPGFADIVAGDYRVAAGSLCVDAGEGLPAAVAAYPVTTQFRPPVGGAPRVVIGAAADLGSFECGTPMPTDPPPTVVPPAPPPPSPPATLLAPVNLRAVAVSPTSIRLEWLDRSQNETGFVIERWQPRGGWRVVGTVAANVTRFTDQGLRARAGYTYRVRAIDASGTTARLSPPTRAATAWTPAAVRSLRFGR